MFVRPAVTAALLIASAIPAAAQQTQTGNWSLRIPSGALISTGTQRDHVKDAQLTGVQLTHKLNSAVAVTGTFAWARSHDLGLTDAPKLDVFTSDIGVETCSHELGADGPVSLKTFAGIGGGMRSYNYRSVDADATNNPAGYVAAGGELGIRRIGLRVEGRDYATGFKPLAGAGKSERRNDVMIMVGVTFNRSGK